MDSPGPGSQMVENDFYVKSVAENNAQSHFTYGMQGSGLTSGDASRETGEFCGRFERNTCRNDLHYTVLEFPVLSFCKPRQLLLLNFVYEPDLF